VTRTTEEKNKRMMRTMLLVVACMIGVSFASVPLYRIFCQVTGFGGTPLMGGEPPPPEKISKRTITILFDARVDSGLPWEFKPETRKMTVQIGQQALINFKGSNLSAQQTTGTAVYNVTPEKVAGYFHKTQCFCFAKQDLAPGKTAHFPVMYFIDPEILNDPEMNDITDITLSYTFFPTDSEALDKAIETYGQQKN
jgi:cytochrome c oxidase assembly protein subunit 11